MKMQSRGISLDKIADYYDLLTYSEKSRFRKKQVELTGLRTGDRILDIGCGTGAISLLSKITLGDEVKVCGIDISSKMIKNARNKADALGLDVEFAVASVDDIPYPDETFTLVTSSLMFHHLPVNIKEKALKEVHRVLTPEGRFFLCDFGKPAWYYFPLSFLLLFWTSHTRSQLFGGLPVFLSNGGFRKVELLKKGALLDYYMAYR